MRAGEVHDRITLSDGRKVVLRALRSSDLALGIEFANCLVDERAENPLLGILLDKRVTRKDELDFLKRQLKGIREGNLVNVAAFSGSKMVGNSSIIRRPFSDVRHSGSLGIGIRKEFRGEGLGRRMLEVLLEKAEGEGILLVELEVFATNKVARRLYENLGFVTFGVVPKGLLRNGKFIDAVRMYRQA